MLANLKGGKVGYLAPWHWKLYQARNNLITVLSVAETERNKGPLIFILFKKKEKYIIVGRFVILVSTILH